MRHLTTIIALLLASYGSAAFPENGQEISSLKKQMKQLRKNYERNLNLMERRITELENEQRKKKKQKQTQSKVSVATRAEAPNATTRNLLSSPGKRGFNPAVSLILSGTAAKFKQNPDNYSVPGFVLGEETGPGENGFSLGESELVISANIDHRFFGRMTLAITGENEVEVEEALIRTLGRGGVTIQAGRFFSNLGYLNSKHAHTWNFIDLPLSYRTILGNQYNDDGLQIKWVAPTDHFLQFGAEAFRGASFPASGDQNNGVGSYTVFMKTGGDVGHNSSWQFGAWYLDAKVGDRTTDSLTFNGDATLYGVDLVWKTNIGRASGQRKIIFNAEYINRNEDGFYSGISQRYDAEQSGWYTELVYQHNKRWKMGVRYDSVEADNPGVAFSNTALDPSGHSSSRVSLMLEHRISEYSRLRLQYNNDQSNPGTDHQWLLQYVMSIGAHGAHRF